MPRYDERLAGAVEPRIRSRADLVPDRLDPSSWKQLADTIAHEDGRARLLLRAPGVQRRVDAVVLAARLRRASRPVLAGCEPRGSSACRRARAASERAVHHLVATPSPFLNPAPRHLGIVDDAAGSSWPAFSSSKASSSSRGLAAHPIARAGFEPTVVDHGETGARPGFRYGQAGRLRARPDAAPRRRLANHRDDPRRRRSAHDQRRHRPRHGVRSSVRALELGVRRRLRASAGAAAARSMPDSRSRSGCRRAPRSARGCRPPAGSPSGGGSNRGRLTARSRVREEEHVVDELADSVDLTPSLVDDSDWSAPGRSAVSRSASKRASGVRSSRDTAAVKPARSSWYAARSPGLLR